MLKQEPLPEANEEDLEELAEKYDDDELTLYKVHAVAGWTKTDQRRFDSWTLIETEASGEEKELMHRMPGSNGDKPGKELIKDRARELARDNKPAVVEIEDRDFNTHRVEVAE